VRTLCVQLQSKLRCLEFLPRFWETVFFKPPVIPTILVVDNKRMTWSDVYGYASDWGGTRC
jgi:hypothetical protein